MNQKLIIGVIALIIVAGGIGLYSSSNPKTELANNDAMMQNEDFAMSQEKNPQAIMENEPLTPEQMETTRNDEMMEKSEGAMMSKQGSYETYEASKIAMASATQDVVLFFRAGWCPKCISLEKDIKANVTAIPENLTILTVDYDNSTELKKKYGVTYQHTFVQVDAQGNLIKKWSSSPTLARLVAEVK